MENQTTYIVSIDEVADILGLSVSITKKILIENRLPSSVGFALSYENGGRISYRYIVFRHRLIAFLNAENFTIS